MRNETVERTYAYFSELSEERQKQEIEKVQEDQYYLDYPWYEYSIDEWEEHLEELGFIDPDISFTGFYSQGDGASFSCEIDLEILYKKHPELFVPQWYRTEKIWSKLSEKRKIDFLKDLLSFKIIKDDHRYSHEYTMDIHENCEWFDTNPMNGEWIDRSKGEYEKGEVELLSDRILEFARSKASEIYVNLEKEHDYLLSEECIRDYLDNGEDEYLISEEIIGE